MKIKRAFLSLGVITLLYLGVLIAADAMRGAFANLAVLAWSLPALMGLSALSYVVRYCRWHWLLTRFHSCRPLSSSFLAYIAGFAFTATPGKVGELVRIRYLQPLGVLPSRVISAFIYERAVDLIAVLLIATLAAMRSDMLAVAMVFVATFLMAVVLLARSPRVFDFLAAHLRLRRFGRLSRLVRLLKEGLRGAGTWINPGDLLVSLTLGLLAWGLTSTAFIVLMWRLGIPVQMPAALAIYPLAMLVGAASMLPGGVGSTEAAIVALLAVLGTAIDLAVLAAIGIRIASLWFSILSGLIAMLVLESRRGLRT